MHAHFSFTKHVVCFRLLAKKAALKECIRRSQWNGKLEEKKKSKCVFLDFTEITSHHHKYACRKKVRGWNVVCIVSLGFLFLLPSNENNPYKYHIQINRRERISSSNPPCCKGKNSCCNKKKTHGDHQSSSTFWMTGQSRFNHKGSHYFHSGRTPTFSEPSTTSLNV